MLGEYNTTKDIIKTRETTRYQSVKLPNKVRIVKVQHLLPATKYNSGELRSPTHGCDRTHENEIQLKD